MTTQDEEKVLLEKEIKALRKKREIEDLKIERDKLESEIDKNASSGSHEGLRYNSTFFRAIRVAIYSLIIIAMICFWGGEISLSHPDSSWIAEYVAVSFVWIFGSIIFVEFILRKILSYILRGK